jgi:hypothetical protein
MTDQLPAAIGQATHAVSALVAAAGDCAGIRFLEFFAANIRNPHTRRAYARAPRAKSVISTYECSQFRTEFAADSPLEGERIRTVGPP